MRAATIPTLASALLLMHCGARGDLIIGELALTSAGSATVIPSGGVTATAGTASSDPGGVGGSGGSMAEAGLGGTPQNDGGAPDNAGGDFSDCQATDEAPVGSLLHRYSFDGTGANVTDSVGNATGNLVNGALLDGSGVLTLPGEHDGQPDQYLNLPNGLISPLSEVTIVAWTTWTGGAGYQRVFDFGISDLGEVQGNSGKSYIDGHAIDRLRQRHRSRRRSHRTRLRHVPIALSRDDAGPAPRWWRSHSKAASACSSSSAPSC